MHLVTSKHDTTEVEELQQTNRELGGNDEQSATGSRDVFGLNRIECSPRWMPTEWCRAVGS
jgi:hypothetical protein